MPTVLRVFIGAPTASDLRTNQAGSLQDQWINVTSSQPLSRRRLSLEFVPLLPPATLEAASRRISEVYKYAIFQDENDEEGERDKTQAMIIDRTEHEGQTTVITWDLTPSRGANHDNSIEIERSLMSITASRIETQETQSYIYSDTSSIARFPTFNINLHSLTSLSIITKSKGKGTSKVNMLLAVLEVDGPETIRLKKGPDAGKEISILKLILGDEEGSLCKLTAWREVAEAWSGADDCIAVKRGDVILLQNVIINYDPSTSPTITASPYLKSRLEICYRTMPCAREDIKLRPDLRLGASDAAVRRVETIVRWFEKMAGL
ncbi:hypothetical protein Moror_9083 [Moniliophthora roreri MCA 2997]|uniref:Shieldin complex subunit 2 first OB fold domain-containing protein n=2 Tax=Moniliophthora roreri TaxID=221103 RepID=V2XK52_MONRO|nr:hypothetical protein Moror_9083 [Moniliophthora roreri MCA 2997]KAI3607744.1 hypothetical protein WG66_005219 [Moniliophthora roreri]